VKTVPTKITACIYTAIYGGYEELLTQPRQTVDCDFVCFTDDPDLTGEGWNVVYMPGDSSLSPAMQARYCKILPHEVFTPIASANSSQGQSIQFRSYDYTIWIDGNGVIRSESFVEEMIGYLGQSGIAMFMHPERDCIYEEAEACLKVPKLQGLRLREQVSHYRSEGYPEHNGLFACAVIVRDMCREEPQKIGEALWEEILRWTPRDQLALPYVLWKNNYTCDVIRHYIWNNHLLRWEHHYKERLDVYKQYGITRQPSRPPTGKCEGHVDVVDCNIIAGWVWDPRQPDTPLAVDIYDGKTKLDTITADWFREDLRAAGKGNGAHGFIYHVPDSLRDGKPHSIRVAVAFTKDSLNGQNPATLRCSPI
jgi:Protein of unknown function (DUF616)